jgi:hypothetical protein
VFHRLAEPDKRSRFALPERGRRDGGNIDVFRVRAVLEPLEGIEPELRYVRAAVDVEVVRGHLELLGDLVNVTESGVLCDVKV